jgi:hypothetical protein
MLILFRNFYDAQKGLDTYISLDEENLEKAGYSHFIKGETLLGSRRVVTLDFDRPHADGSTGTIHQYLLVEGTLLYTLSFSTTASMRDMIPLTDRMATSFTFDPST